MKGQLRIEEMFAFIVLDDADNTEGIPALNHDGMAYPMVGADMEMVEKLRPYAERIARRLKKKITLVKFTNRVELEEIE